MQKEKWKNRWARWLKLRFLVLYPFGVWAVVSRHSTDESIMKSIWFILLGLGMRTWANCYAIKMERLTTCGPYAYVRHPLYLGSFLIMIGFLVMLNIPWIGVLLFVLIVIGVIYKTTIKNEEKMLLDKFGFEYIEYKKAVPAFLPKVLPFKGSQKWAPSISRYFKSQEYKLVIWMIVLMIAFHLKEEFIVEHERFDAKIITLLITAFLLGVLDILGEVVRKKTIRH